MTEQLILIESLDHLQTEIDKHNISIINFHAEWCPPCVTMELFFDELVEDTDFSIPILRVDTDEHDWVTHQYNVRSNPTTVFTKNGTEVVRETRMLDASEIKEIIETVK